MTLGPPFHVVPGLIHGTLALGMSASGKGDPPTLSIFAHPSPNMPTPNGAPRSEGIQEGREWFIKVTPLLLATCRSVVQAALGPEGCLAPTGRKASCKMNFGKRHALFSPSD